MNTETHCKRLSNLFELARMWAKETGITIVTASQPRRGGPGLAPEQIIELAKQPLVVDYVGLMVPSPSKTLVPVKE